MPLSASTRIGLIREIGERLRDSDWSYIELCLDQFGCKNEDIWQGHAFQYVLAMLKDASDDKLIALAKHVGHDIEDEGPIVIPSFWEPGKFRLFVSHLARHKKEAGELKDWLGQKGVSAFVAHDDIAPTKEWLDEIVAALESCQAVVALLRNDFHASQWTDQELGFAMGRRLLIIAVRLGQDPYGFFGKFQALTWDEANVGELAQKIVDILQRHEKTSRTMAEIVVTNLENSKSWERSKELGRQLIDLVYWDNSLSDRCRIALEVNEKVKTAYNVPGQINYRTKMFERDS